MYVCIYMYVCIDVHKISLFPKFQLITISYLWVLHDYVYYIAPYTTLLNNLSGTIIEVTNAIIKVTNAK